MNDRISKADKLEVQKRLGKASRQSSTYYQQAIIDLGLENASGRFANKPIVTGQTKAVEYPAASTPWTAQADPGLEPSLGYEIDAQEATGTFEEIERSLAEQGEPDADGMVPDQSSLGVDQQRSGSPPSSQRRSVLSTPSALDATEKARLTAEQHRVLSGNDLPLLHPPSTKLAGGSADPPVGIVGSATVSSPVASRLPLANPSADQPDDGLDVPRRIDGMPLSSHAVKPRRKI